MAKVQNIEELLNGIKDFTGGQKKLMVLVVPYLNSWKMLHLDKDTSDEDRVVDDDTPAKGLEFSCFLWEWKKTCFQAP
jgi:DNA helicase-2/ATP-dependent DNA helicase PcrA